MTRRPKTEKVNHEANNILRDKIAELKSLFPECVTEGQVDFERLKETLEMWLMNAPNATRLPGPGNGMQIRILQTPSRATLTPAPKESINFENTQNIFVEGDNLEALKLLYKSYFGRVKLVFIDPPYNTGNDFVYPDNFADPLDSYLQTYRPKGHTWKLSC